MPINCSKENGMKPPKRIVLVQNDPYLVSTRKAMLERQGYVS